MSLGNQQFTMRNLTFSNSVTAIEQTWNWGWLYKGITIDNCSIGLNMSAGGPTDQGVGSVTLIDSVIRNTPIGVLTAHDSSSEPSTGGGLILENIQVRPQDSLSVSSLCLIVYTAQKRACRCAWSKWYSTSGYDSFLDNHRVGPRAFLYPQWTNQLPGTNNSQYTPCLAHTWRRILSTLETSVRVPFCQVFHKCQIFQCHRYVLR